MDLDLAMRTTGAVRGVHRRAGRRRHALPGARPGALRAEWRQPPAVAGRRRRGRRATAPGPRSLRARLARVLSRSSKRARCRSHPAPTDAEPIRHRSRGRTRDAAPVRVRRRARSGSGAARHRLRTCRASPCSTAGFERQSIIGGGSIYPFGQNLLLSARSEGLAGVMTTFLVRQEEAARGRCSTSRPTSRWPRSSRSASPRSSRAG